MRMLVPEGVPESVVLAVVAINARNADAFLLAFHPDATLDDRGVVSRGTQQIGQWGDTWVRALGVTLESVIFVPSPAVTELRARWRCADVTEPLSFSFVVVDELVSALSIAR